MKVFYVLELKEKVDGATPLYYAGWIDRLNHLNYKPREAVTISIETAARWECEAIAHDALDHLPRPQDFEVVEHSY